MPRYLLDTGIVIRHLRGQQNIVQLMRNLGKQERLSISTITRLEVRAGMHPDESYKTQKLLSRFTIFDLNRDVADRAGDLIRQSPRGIAVPDAIIAATALMHQLTLVTLNRKDFVSISGISLFPIPNKE